jgi:hypothetical protein
MAISKRLIKINERPFHTSAYAQTVNAGRVGATSTVSFERRQQIEQNRQKVGGYRHSSLGRTVSEFKPKTITNLTVSIPTTPAEASKPYNPYG